MLNFTKTDFKLSFLIGGACILLVSSCASVQQPGGGPRDTQPPKVIREEPKNLTRNFKAKQINIKFDEFVKLSNEFTEVSISPALEKMPTFKARKQDLSISFEDTLERNTTYTINFGKAVADVNESNILKNYTYVFSTGPRIDSLSISGSVVSSANKQALKDVTVFILPVKQDSILGKKRPSIFTTTDSAGNFKLSNLKEDKYFLYALKEAGGDRIYNPEADEIGFLKDTITLNKDTAGLKLEVFKENPSSFKLKDRKIEKDGRITLVFNKSLIAPAVNIREPKTLEEQKRLELSAKKDSALIWLPSLTFDSLKVVISDQGKNLDTSVIYRNKRDTYSRQIAITDNLNANNKLKPGSELILTLSSPIATADKSKLVLLEDSVKVGNFDLVKDPDSFRKYLVKYNWHLNKTYDLTLGDNAFTDISGAKSKQFKRSFIRDTEENYGNISIQVIVPDTAKSYVVQWLNDQENVLREDKISKNTQLNYLRYPTAKYHIRVVYDENKNGKWDTGDLRSKMQPEKTWNFDKDLTLRPNWDLEEKVVIPQPQ